MEAIWHGPVRVDAPTPDRAGREHQERSRRGAESAASSRQASPEPGQPAQRLTGTICDGGGGNDAAPAVWIAARAARPTAGLPHKTATCPSPERREAMARARAGPRAQKPSTTARLPWAHPDSEDANTAAVCEGSGANFSVAAAPCCQVALRLGGDEDLLQGEGAVGLHLEEGADLVRRSTPY
jgi:hypothetical protein